MRSRLLVLLLLSVGLSACASVPAKQSATFSTQAIEKALAAAQDFERTVCFVTPAAESGPHCTNPIAATVQLTDARHVAFAQALSRGFDGVIRLATALRAWRAGDPAPTSLGELITVAQEALAVAQRVLDTSGSKLVASVQAVLDALAALSKSLAGGAR